MKIDVTRFCGLSRRDDFQEWLKSISIEYHDELINFLKLGKSCGDNKVKMEEIYGKLSKAGKSGLLIQFLKERYPHMLIFDNENVNRAPVKPSNQGKENTVVKEVKPEIIVTLEELNYHKVFQIYKPGLMLLPHQMIFVDFNKNNLENKIINFTRTKIETDYIILKGPKFFHGYIEYFEKKFAGEASSVKPQNRPIFIYKRKNNHLG